jgi:ribonuclease BN (tRNA processing enzyme)
LQLTILGSSPSFANAGGASSGYLASTDATEVLVDCGHGIVGKLQQYANPRSLSAVIISHMHPDHIFDLVPLKYAFLFQSIPSIPLWLPPGGIDTLARLQAAVGLDADFFSQSFAVAEYDPQETLGIGVLEIRFAATKHYIPGNAMRFSTAADGVGDLFFSADTGWTVSVLELARDAALALVEASVLDESHLEPPPGHLSGKQAGRFGREAGVGRLVLTHYYGPIAKQLLEDARRAFGGDVELAREGQTFTI